MRRITYMTPEQIEQWVSYLDIPYVQAANQLGITPKSLHRYRSGTSPVPKSISLACKAIAAGLTPHSPSKYLTLTDKNPQHPST